MNMINNINAAKYKIIPNHVSVPEQYLKKNIYLLFINIHYIKPTNMAIAALAAIIGQVVCTSLTHLEYYCMLIIDDMLIILLY